MGEERFNGGDGRAGVEDEAVEATEGTDAGEGGGVIVSRFDVNADEIGAGLRKGFDVVLWSGQHEMGVEEKFRARTAEGGKGLGAEGEVGDEVSVHDIAVQPGQAEVGHETGAGGKIGVVAGEEGRCEDRGVRRGHGDAESAGSARKSSTLD